MHDEPRIQEVEADDRLRLAIARGAILMLIAAGAWIFAALRFDVGTSIMTPIIVVFLGAAVTAKFAVRPAPVSTVRIAPDVIELICSGGRTRSVARSDVSSVHARGRVIRGFVVPRTLGIGHAQLTFLADDGRMVLDHSIAWVRGDELAAAVSTAGIKWLGVTDRYSDPTGLNPALWPPEIPRPSKEAAISDPATAQSAQRFRRRAALGSAVFLGALAAWLVLPDWVSSGGRATGVGFAGLSYVAFELVGRSLMASWSKRRIVHMLSDQQWWAYEALVYAPPKAPSVRGVGFSGKLMQLIESGSGRLSLPYVIAPGLDTDWLMPTQRQWVCCTATTDGSKMLIAPPDRSSIAYCKLVAK